MTYGLDEPLSTTSSPGKAKTAEQATDKLFMLMEDWL